jgi:hypothetical protein
MDTECDANETMMVLLASQMFTVHGCDVQVV